MGRTGFRIFFASLLLAGCGSVKDSGTAIDAPVGDAGPDADESGMATVTTKALLAGQTAGMAVGDIDLISMLPDNSVFATGKTDASGNGTIKVYPGGSVTAVYKHLAPDLGADLATFVGVKPGDNLEFGLRSTPVTNNTSLGAQTYSWPTAPNGAVTTYRAHTSCTTASAAAPTLSASGTESSSCHKTPMDIVYTATTSNPTTLVHCGFRSNVTFSAGANVALGAWSNAVPATTSVTGLPSYVTNVTTQFLSVIDGGTERFLSGGGSASGATSGGAFTGNFPWCLVGERTSAQLFLGRPGNFANVRVLDSLPSSTTSWTVANPVLPPWVEGQFIVSAALGFVQWPLVPDENSASDAVVLQISFNQRVNNMDFGGNWYFVMPPNTQVQTLPTLPTPFQDFMPFRDFGIGLNRIFTYDIPTIDGYDSLRGMGFGTAFCPDCAVRAGEIQRLVFSGF